jgi:hypothetical protein
MARLDTSEFHSFFLSVPLQFGLICCAACTFHCVILVGSSIYFSTCDLGFAREGECWSCGPWLLSHVLDIRHRIWLDRLFTGILIIWGQEKGEMRNETCLIIIPAAEWFISESFLFGWTACLRFLKMRFLICLGLHHLLGFAYQIWRLVEA